MKAPPPKSKNPIGGNRQGSENNNPHLAKEIVMSNVITFAQIVNNGPKNAHIKKTHTAQIIPFPQRKMSGMETILRKFLRVNDAPEARHRLQEMLDMEMRQCALKDPSELMIERGLKRIEMNEQLMGA